MFNTDQKRTFRITLAALVVGFVIAMLGGCDGSGAATDTDAGTGTLTSTKTSTLTTTATSTLSFATTVTATFARNTTVITTHTNTSGTTFTYTTTAVSTRPIVNVNNPCATATGCSVNVNNGMQVVPLITCGWESTSGTCYTTSWCEASVVSAGTNAAYGSCGEGGPACTETQNGFLAITTLVRLRPRSAVCSGGVTSYTFKAGELMVWGGNASGTQYSSSAIRDDGYICVPSSQDITVNC